MASQWREISRFRNAYILAMSAAMGSMFDGWDIGLIGGIIALDSFKQYFGTDKMSISQRANVNGNIVSVLQGGCFFGALSTGYLSSQFGRKRPLIASGIIYLIGSLIQSVAGLGSSQAVALRVLYFSRFLGGIGTGMVTALVPSYISECTPPSIRGRCTGLVQLTNNIGIMLSFWINYSASKDITFGEMQWRIPFIMQMVPGILFVSAMIFQPESPRWLVEHGKHDSAARALAFLERTREDDKGVLLMLEEIKADFAGKKTISIWKQFAKMGESRAIALRCFIPSLVMLFRQWNGTNAINYFSPQIFSGLGISGTTASLFATGIYGVVKVVAVGLVLAFAVESVGRKKCLIIGGLGQGMMMLWIGGYSGIHRGEGTSPAGYVSIVAIYLYAVFYCIGWGPLPWVVASEVAPNHLRMVANSIAIGVNWLSSLAISKLTPIMLNKITYGTFLLFGACCLIMASWAYVCLPETKGYALEDIRFLFEKDVILRALQDAPGGKAFIGKRRVESVEALRHEFEVLTTKGSSSSDVNVTL